MKPRAFLVFSSVVLILFSCEKKNPDEKSINRSWEVSRQYVSGELKSIIAPPNEAIHTGISIVIPITNGGTVNVNTFFNSTWVDFEIKNEQQISFKNYGDSRLPEDENGVAFRENLLNTVKFEILTDKLLFINSQGQTIIELVEN
jgi:hypothetical protein